MLNPLYIFNKPCPFFPSKETASYLDGGKIVWMLSLYKAALVEFRGGGKIPVGLDGFKKNQTHSWMGIGGLSMAIWGQMRWPLDQERRYINQRQACVWIPDAKEQQLDRVIAFRPCLWTSWKYQAGGHWVKHDAGQRGIPPDPAGPLLRSWASIGRSMWLHWWYSQLLCLTA